jgi:hypothetical protein
VKKAHDYVHFYRRYWVRWRQVQPNVNARNVLLAYPDHSDAGDPDTRECFQEARRVGMCGAGPHQ